MNIQPTTLEGTHVRLEPFTLDHLDALCEVGLDPELWKFTTSLVRTREEMQRYIETALEWQKNGTALPFAIIEKKSGKVVGSTRYANIERTHRRLEIGWTWIAKPWQRAQKLWRKESPQSELTSE